MCWLLDRSWTSGTPLLLPFLNLCQAAMWHQCTYSWNTAASKAWSLRLEFCLLCPARLFSLSIPQTHHLGRYCFPIYSQGTESAFRSILQKNKLLTFGNALLDGYSISQLILYHPPSSSFWGMVFPSKKIPHWFFWFVDGLRVWRRGQVYARNWCQHAWVAWRMYSTHFVA